MKTTIIELPVERNEYGYWTHPEYDKFCDGHQQISSAEFNAWMAEQDMEWAVDYRDADFLEGTDVDGADISMWEPKKPAGEGWFVGSIHDTEDGAVCIWLRNTMEV